MNIAERARLRLDDGDFYKVPVPPDVAVTRDFDEWVRSHERDFASFDEPRRTRGASRGGKAKAQELLQNYQAYYLLFRSADLDTQVLQRNYGIWSGTLMRALRGAEQADTQAEKDYGYMSKDLAYYPDEPYRKKIFELAKGILDKAKATNVSPSLKEAGSSAGDPLEGLPFDESDLNGLVLRIPYNGRYVYLEEGFAKDMVENCRIKV